jgi:hypothetical protein
VRWFDSFSFPLGSICVWMRRNLIRRVVWIQNLATLCCLFRFLVGKKCKYLSRFDLQFFLGSVCNWFTSCLLWISWESWPKLARRYIIRNLVVDLLAGCIVFGLHKGIVRWDVSCFPLSNSRFVLYYGQAKGVEADKKKSRGGNKKATEIFTIKY